MILTHDFSHFLLFPYVSVEGGGYHVFNIFSKGLNLSDTLWLLFQAESIILVNKESHPINLVTFVILYKAL